MNVISRGVRNAFRNNIRTLSVVVILGLSIALALSMLLAHQAVNKKIENIKGSEGNTITVSPAGVRGFQGGGNPLTQTQLNGVSNLAHVDTIEESLNDRLTSTDTNLQSSVQLGQLGQRFATNFGGGSGTISGNSSISPADFTPPVTVLGSNNPTDLANTQGGGTFTLKSGAVFSSTSSDDVALVGTALASKNNLSVGSTFTAYNTTIKVVGIFDSGNDFSNGLLVMPLKTLQTLSSQPGDITSAVVTVDSVSNVNSVTSAIKSKLGSAADVTSSVDQAQTSIDSLNSIKNISVYSLIGAVVAGAVIIFLVMLMIVRERRREIGVFKAIGASNVKIVSQFMAEAVTLTILAAVVGILISLAAAEPITRTLVNNSTSSSSSTSSVQTPGFGASGGAGGGGFARRQQAGTGNGPTFVSSGSGIGRVRNNITNIHAVISWSIVLYGLGAAILIALVGSGIASWSIAKVRPAEVLRTE